MTESDGDIEYLDEDADIVQQCVHSNTQTQPGLPNIFAKEVSKALPDAPVEKLPLLVERTPAERSREKRKKRKKNEEDSDYDPSDDNLPPSPPSPPSPKSKKKKLTPFKKVKTLPKEPVLAPPPHIVAAVSAGKKKLVVPSKETVLNRKKCEIMIPDYEDPLCLPVKAIQYEESDVKRLNNWNNVCLEHFKNCDNLLKPERGDTHSSSRTIVFRNVVNKISRKVETTIWSKTCVENNDGDRKSEIFQCVLPRYKEKKVLNNYNLSVRRSKLQPYHVSDEVILCKEENKDGEVLVAYKPKERTSSVYKLVLGYDGRSPEVDEDDGKMYMKELAHCQMCVRCFQSSWRGVRKTQKRNVECPICGRSSVTVYNLLTHFKTHSSEDIKKYKKVISAILAEIVEYHYKCRVCREQFSNIKGLRQHLSSHQGTETIKCEVGNHFSR